MNLAPRGVVPLTFLLAACAERPVAPDATVDRPPIARCVDLGTGQLYWEDLDADAGGATRVELIHGPQGGYHIFGRVRFDCFGPDVYVRFRVAPVGGGAPVNDPMDRIRLVEARGLVPSGPGWESSNALLVVLTAVRHPSVVVGQRFRFEAFVSMVPSGPEVTVAREIVIVDDT